MPAPVTGKWSGDVTVQHTDACPLDGSRCPASPAVEQPWWPIRPRCVMRGQVARRPAPGLGDERQFRCLDSAGRHVDHAPAFGSRAGRAASLRDRTVAAFRPRGGWRSPSTIASTNSTSTAARSLSIWQVPAASWPPPPWASISAPMSSLRGAVEIERPTANTVFCCLRPHSTWIDTLHSGYSA